MRYATSDTTRVSGGVASGRKSPLRHAHHLQQTTTPAREGAASLRVPANGLLTSFLELLLDLLGRQSEGAVMVPAHDDEVQMTSVRRKVPKGRWILRSCFLEVRSRCPLCRNCWFAEHAEGSVRAFCVTVR
jgi:hypothetical protein